MRDVHILLVEDNDGDVLLTIEAFEENKIANRMSVVRDGKAAIDFLRKHEPYTNTDFPDLILLDINLPKLNGIEVLQQIKGNEAWKHIPVVMLTTSSSDNDIMESYKNYVNCYITKPVNATDFVNVVSRIENFWIRIVQLP